MDPIKILIPQIPGQEDMIQGICVMFQHLGFQYRKADNLMWVLEITQERLTEWTKRTGMPNWNTNHMPTPRTIFEIARKDPTVNACVELWKSGQIAWEQALMMAVCCLSTEKDDYMGQLVKMKEEEVVPIIVPMCRDPQHQAEFLASMKPPPGPG